MTREQRLEAAKKALEAALREWHKPATKADWQARWTAVMVAAEELRKARKDAAL